MPQSVPKNSQIHIFVQYTAADVSKKAKSGNFKEKVIDKKPIGYFERRDF